MSAVIRVDSLNKTFARKQALFNLKLEIQAGEMVALIGASGSANPRSCVTSPGSPAATATTAAASTCWVAACRRPVA